MIANGKLVSKHFQNVMARYPQFGNVITEKNGMLQLQQNRSILIELPWQGSRNCNHFMIANGKLVSKHFRNVMARYPQFGNVITEKKMASTQ